MIKKISLVDIKMRKDKHKQFLFTLTYHAEHTDGKIDEYILKDVRNPFSTNNFEIERGCINELGDVEHYFTNQISLILPDRCLPILSREVTCQTIKEADPIEVTIEEIEEKYGRPVKIVKSKEDK